MVILIQNVAGLAAAMEGSAAPVAFGRHRVRIASAPVPREAPRRRPINGAAGLEQVILPRQSMQFISRPANVIADSPIPGNAAPDESATGGFAAAKDVSPDSLRGSAEAELAWLEKRIWASRDVMEDLPVLAINFAAEAVPTSLAALRQPAKSPGGNHSASAHSVRLTTI